METLTCNTCGKDWQRKVVRGRKPKVCPSCKEQGNTKPTSPRNSAASTNDSEASEPVTTSTSGNFYSFTTDSGDTMATRNEVYARRRNAGVSFCCAGTTHLGYLCKREQEQNSITCTCDCHEEQEAA